MATEVDAVCSTLIERSGLYENTLVIFMANNGNVHGEHKLAEGERVVTAHCE